MSVSLQLKRYGDGSDWPHGQSWFFIELKVKTAKLAIAEYESQLVQFTQRNHRILVFESGDGHCGFWVVVRQVLVKLGVISHLIQKSPEAVQRAHLYLSAALHKHAPLIAQLLLYDVLLSDANRFENSDGGFEENSTGEFIPSDVTGDPIVRTEKRKLHFLAAREKELRERSVAQIGADSRMSFLPMPLWFGGLEFSDAVAIAKESNLKWIWIVEGSTSVFIFAPSGERSLVDLKDVVSDKNDVVSIYDGTHFNSYVHA